MGPVIAHTDPSRTDTHADTHIPADRHSLTHNRLPFLHPRAPYLGKHSAPCPGVGSRQGGGRSPGESGQAATNPGWERGGTHVRAGTAGWRASEDIPSHTRGRLGT